MGNLAIWAMKRSYCLGDISQDAVLSEVHKLGGGQLEESVVRRLNSITPTLKVNQAGARNWFTAAYTSAYQTGMESAKDARTAGLLGWGQLDEFRGQYRDFSYKLGSSIDNAILGIKETAAIPPHELEILLGEAPEELFPTVKQAIILTGISNTGNCRSTFKRLMDYAYLAGASSLFVQQGLFLLTAHAYVGMRLCKKRTHSG